MKGQSGQASALSIALVVAVSVLVLAALTSLSGFSSFNIQPVEEQMPIEQLAFQAQPQNFQISEVPSDATNLPAAVLIAPFWVYDDTVPETENTRFTITNTGRSSETVKLFFFTNDSCVKMMDCAIVLSRDQIFSFTPANPGLSSGRGWMLAFTIDGDENAIGHNTLLGSVEFKASTGHYGGYNMAGFRSLNGNTGPAGTLTFDGVNLEQWPNYMMPQFLTADDDSNRIIFVSPPSDVWAGTFTGFTNQILVYNSYAQNFSTSEPMSSCYFESSLNRIDTDNPAESIFSRNITGTEFGDALISPVGGDCPNCPIIGLYMRYDSNEGTDANAYSGVQLAAAKCQTSCASFNITYGVPL